MFPKEEKLSFWKTTGHPQTWGRWSCETGRQASQSSSPCCCCCCCCLSSPWWAGQQASSSPCSWCCCWWAWQRASSSQSPLSWWQFSSILPKSPYLVSSPPSWLSICRHCEERVCVSNNRLENCEVPAFSTINSEIFRRPALWWKFLGGRLRRRQCIWRSQVSLSNKSFHWGNFMKILAQNISFRNSGTEYFI